MNNRKVPQVADLIDDAIVKVAAFMQDEKITPTTLATCLNMLLAVDKNDREIKSTFGRDIKTMPDDKLYEMIQDNESLRHLFQKDK